MQPVPIVHILNIPAPSFADESAVQLLEAGQYSRKKLLRLENRQALRFCKCIDARRRRSVGQIHTNANDKSVVAS